MADTPTLRYAIAKVAGLGWIADDILALPVMVAHLRVVEAARAWYVGTADSEITDLENAVADLDALEAERG